MLAWPYRHQLSMKHRLRRSVYEMLRDQMDINLIKHALVGSHSNFVDAGEPYPFVPKRELKPKARVIEQEYNLQNHFLVILCEGTIPSVWKKYIRFFDSNKVTKEAIEEMPYITLHKKYTKNLRYFDNPDFGSLVTDLTPVDYALLVQQDPAVKTKNRYHLNHFHVRIDWPLDEATEDMGLELRYIAKELYENGEKYAESLHHKLYERYGFHHVVGGRRTAAVVAAELLRKMDFISTVYVSSAEARTLTRISERGVSKYVLVKVPMADVSRLVKENNMRFDKFVERYLLDMDKDNGVGLLHVVYRNAAHSKPPEDGKLRKLQPEYQWLTVADQLLIPLPGNQDSQAIRYHTIYTAD